MIEHAAAFLLAGLCGTAIAGGLADRGVNPTDTIRAACKYDIVNSKNSLFSSVRAGDESGAYKTYKTRFELAAIGKTLSGSMTFNCLVPTGDRSGAVKSTRPRSEDQSQSEPVLGPKALIESEDAGGRYARTVVWQRPLPSTRWSADVAYVNAVLGDGQRSPVNVFLVCNRTVAMPCIEVELDQHVPLSNALQRGVLEFLGQIAPSTN